jgi:ubiquinol-cytochrome c reductase iron-sulfur subunit
MKPMGAIAACFIVSALSSLGLTAVYVSGGQPQLEGALLAISLGGIALGLVFLAKEFLPHGPFVQERSVSLGRESEQDEVAESLDEGTETIERRGFIAKLIGLALGTLGIAALFPIRSLGTRPGRELFSTPWDIGVKLVTKNGVPVHIDDVPINGVLTVFPQEYTDAADAQTLLIRLPEDEAAPGPDGYSVDGLVAFSKVCTHAGCPVGLYQAETRELFCPCHQSVFAVMQAAKPTGGPATRPLPQLPIGADEDGFLEAKGDFPEPIGPGFWSRGRA